MPSQVPTSAHQWGTEATLRGAIAIGTAMGLPAPAQLGQKGVRDTTVASPITKSIHLVCRQLPAAQRFPSALPSPLDISTGLSRNLLLWEVRSQAPIPGWARRAGINHDLELSILWLCKGAGAVPAPMGFAFQTLGTSGSGAAAGANSPPFQC